MSPVAQVVRIQPARYSEKHKYSSNDNDSHHDARVSLATSLRIAEPVGEGKAPTNRYDAREAETSLQVMWLVSRWSRAAKSGEMANTRTSA